MAETIAARIVNIGSLNIDEVFRVRDFARPGETMSALEYAVFPGGKGCNQSIALARAGANVAHAGMIGSDGRFLVKLLREAGVDTTSVMESPIPTGRAFIQVREDGQNCILLSGGANREISGHDVDAMLAGKGTGDWLLMQNEISGVGYAMEQAARKGMRIFFNPSPADSILSGLPLELVDCLIFNEIEGEAISGESRIEEILDELGRRLPRTELVLTLGAYGVAWRAPRECGPPEFGKAGHDAGTIRLPARQVAAVDTTAAGDTFTGFFIASRSRGADARTALAMAIDAAALCVTRKGAASSIPVLEELEAFRDMSAE